jgi:hypothetical protein
VSVFEGVFGVKNSGTPYIAGLDWGSFSIIAQQADEGPDKPLPPTVAPRRRSKHVGSQFQK